LLDSRGRLVGVNTMIYSPTGAAGGNVGIGFAIPVDTVRRVVNQLIRYGKVVRPTLGIQVVDDRVANNVARQLGRATLGGVLVAEVLPRSPAAQAGLQATSLKGDGSLLLGDLVTQVNGQPVAHVEDLLAAIEERQVGDSVRLTMQRACDPTRTVYVQVKLVSRDAIASSTNSRGTLRKRP
jgi:S1-C subfamily serine protease